MSREFPDFLDPWKAADGQRRFQGTMPIKRMKRLLPMLAPMGEEQDGKLSDPGEASFSARFSYDEQDLLTIHLAVEAGLMLMCQRSLVPYCEKLERRSILAVIEDTSEQDELPEIYDPVLVEHRRMALLDIVEEELILAVPQVPKNPDIETIEFYYHEYRKKN